MPCPRVPAGWGRLWWHPAHLRRCQGTNSGEKKPPSPAGKNQRALQTPPELGQTAPAPRFPCLFPSPGVSRRATPLCKTWEREGRENSQARQCVREALAPAQAARALHPNVAGTNAEGPGRSSLAEITRRGRKERWERGFGMWQHRSCSLRREFSLWRLGGWELRRPRCPPRAVKEGSEGGKIGSALLGVTPWGPLWRS